MEFNYIINPETGRKCSIKSKIGKKVLFNYVQYLKGGSDSEDEWEREALKKTKEEGQVIGDNDEEEETEEADDDDEKSDGEEKADYDSDDDDNDLDNSPFTEGADVYSEDTEEVKKFLDGPKPKVAIIALGVSGLVAAAIAGILSVTLGA